MALQKIPGRAIQLDSQVSSDVMYFDGTDWVRLAKGEAGEVLTVNITGTAPEWGTPPYVFPGTVRGYCASGNTDGGGVGEGPKVIDRWSFASDTNSVDVGDVTLGRTHTTGQSSETHGYLSGSSTQGSSPLTLAIDRWSFATEGNATDHGDLALSQGYSTGQSSETHGYHTGGHGVPFNSSTFVNTIQKFAFASTGNTNNATDIADLTVARTAFAGGSSSTHGYTAGGGGPVVPRSIVIDKFPFASDTNATNVGDADVLAGSCAGTSSLTYGYLAGGEAPGVPNTSSIRKYSFTTDGNSVDGGADLTFIRHANSGASSETFGYSAAGFNAGAQNSIEKYSVESDSNATDVGNLTVARWYSSPVGSQV